LDPIGGYIRRVLTKLKSLTSKPPEQKIKMSYLQVEARVRRYMRLLQWFVDQPELAPLNICHCSLITTIYNYLVENANTWGTEDTRALCALADGIVTVYNIPMDIVDLTGDDGPMDDSGLE
jgi:hypothetical protein